ncbi:MAG: hypothetical protein ACHP65_08070 [Legionellales bacterium]
MPKYYTSVYTVSRYNTSYINAISVNKKDMAITKINSYKPELAQPCSELRVLIDRFLNKQFTIEVRSINEASSAGLLPKLEGVDFFALTRTDAVQAKKILAPLRKELDDIMWALFADYSIEGQVIKLTKRGKNFSQIEALLFLNEMQQKWTIEGAMHFTQLNKILFRYNGKSHLLTYGEKPNSLRSMPHIIFDVDDGFVTKNLEIHNALQPYFNAWKRNDYQGPVIPDAYSGFHTLNPVVTLTLEDNTPFKSEPGRQNICVSLCGFFGKVFLSSTELTTSPSLRPQT